MSNKDTLEIKAKLLGSHNVYPGQKIKMELQFINQAVNDIYIKDVILLYECICSINLFHLKKFHKKSDVERILSNFNQQYSLVNKSTQNINDNNNFLLSTTDLYLFENKILRSKDTYKIIVKLIIPEESVPTYKSKYIHFSNTIKIKTNTLNYDVQINGTLIMLNVKEYFLTESCKIVDSDLDEIHVNNPFEIKKNNSNESSENDLLSKLVLEKQASTRYKITYRDSNLCFLTLVKSQMSLGDDIKLVLNFVADSPIRCVKFSVTLKAREVLIIPPNTSIPKELQVCLSTNEFGPYFYDSLCIEIFPLVVKLPNEQYPSLNFDFFKFEWSLDFKFMIAESKEVSIDIDGAAQKQPKSWSVKKDIQTELLKWELPLRVYAQKLSEF